MKTESKCISFDETIKKDITCGRIRKENGILNENTFLSDRYQILFVLISLFIGITGLQYLYIRRKGMFVIHVFSSAAVLLTVPDVLRVYAAILIHIIAAIVPCFVYTDGDGDKLRM